MMKSSYCLVSILVIFNSIQLGFAQSDKNLNMDLVVTDEQKIILFSVFIIAVIALFLYLARDLILRKRTDYDDKNLESKKNRDYEKYHSSWSDDYEEFGSRKYTKEEKEFREALNKSNLPNYYKILGVSEDATREEIKKRYRELAKKLHPDKSKIEKAKEKMAEINKAYEVLEDKELREKYDKYFRS